MKFNMFHLRVLTIYEIVSSVNPSITPDRQNLIEAAHGDKLEEAFKMLHCHVHCKSAAESIFLDAVRDGHVEKVIVLLQCPKVSVNAREPTREDTALILAVRGGWDYIVDLLLRAKKEEEVINVNAQSKDGLTALVLATMNRRERAVELLLRHGATDPNTTARTKNDSGWTALMYACHVGSSEIVTLLLAHDKINANLKSNTGETALIMACSAPTDEACKERVVRLLLTGSGAKVDVNAQDVKGWSALIIAAKKGHGKVVKLLLETSKVNVNAQSVDGWSALMHAASDGNEGIVQAILNYPNAKVQGLQNKTGMTALDLASSGKHKKIAKLLKNYRYS